MIVFNVGGCEYHAKWRFTPRTGNPTTTECFIRDARGFAFGFGCAYRNPGDRNNTPLARELALDRALHRAFPHDKTARKAAWDALAASGMRRSWCA